MNQGQRTSRKYAYPVKAPNMKLPQLLTGSITIPDIPNNVSQVHAAALPHHERGHQTETSVSISLSRVSDQTAPRKHLMEPVKCR